MNSKIHRTGWARARAVALASITALVGLGVGLFGYSVYANESASPNTASSNGATSTGGSATSAAEKAPDDMWAQIQKFHGRMDQLFAQEFGQAGAGNDHTGFAVPNMDVRDLKDHYQVVMDMPGADQSSIKVNVQGQLLSVSGQRTTSSSSDKGQIMRSERSMEAWERAVTMPGPVDASGVKSSYVNGELTITVPKSTANVAAVSTTPKQAETALAANRPSQQNPATAPSVQSPPAAGNSWDQLDQFHNSMDQLFAATFGAPALGDVANAQQFTVPSLDLANHKDHYEVNMDMPGVDKSKIKVDVQGRQLTVSAQRAFGNEAQNGGKAIRSERGTAEFGRTVLLPGPVKVSAVSAKYNDGVLTIDLPKAGASAEPISVTVK